MDIRQLYNSLSPEDKAVYQKIRTDMRKVYLNAHTNIVGIENWIMDDDALLDLIDIKIATLFDRSGRIEGVKSIISDTKPIEDKINNQGDQVTTRMNVVMSEASQKLASIKNGEAKW